ncbi:Protein STRL-1 b [Aphelenchoides avenae]|nr:Protein STRL-1 b [Aphelenchus avenae]
METGPNFVDYLGVRDELDETNQQYLPVLSKGVSALSRCYSIYNSPDFQAKKGWKKELVDGGVSVFSTTNEQGRLFNVHYKCAVPLHEFMEHDWDGVECTPDWNSDVEFARRLVKLTDNADIVHYANKAILMVSGRDYVSVRVKREVDGVFYTSGYSIEDLPEMPPLDGRTRGFLHVNGGRFRQDPSDPCSTLVDSILCLDVRGMIPKSLVNSQLPKQLKMEAEKLKKRLNELYAN